ncbi:MAG TPA: DUF4157 domain-containing protein [Kofleriaceae bacterium]|nr:DUF4157 domain-containing protein [Kofleriaceae bacterium]
MGLERDRRHDHDPDLDVLLEDEIDQLHGELTLVGKRSRIQRLFERLGDQAKRRFDAFVPSLRALRALGGDEAYARLQGRGLREVLVKLGDHDELRATTLAAADPATAQRAVPGAVPGKLTTPAGVAMHRAAERRGATLYRRAVANGEITEIDDRSPEVEAALAHAGSGAELPAALRAEMERELGVSLERVRIHTDDVAADAARAVNAAAFTVGEDVFFAAGAFDAHSTAGKQLIAHELQHVVQGWQGRTAASGVSKPGDALEHEADAVAARVGSRAAARGDDRAEPRPGTDRAEHRHNPGTDRAEPRPGTDRAEPRPVQQVQVAAPSRGALLRKPASGDPAEADDGVPRPGKLPIVSAARDPQAEHEVHGPAQESTTAAEAQATAGKHVNDLKQAVGGATKNAFGQLHDAVHKVKNQPVGKHAHTHLAASAAEHGEKLNRAHKATATHKASQHPHQAETHGKSGAKAGGDAATGPVQLKPISDWNKFLPDRLPGQDDRETKKIESVVKSKIEKKRTESRKLLNSLVTAQLAEASAVRAQKAALEGTVSAGMSKALGEVAAGQAAQVAAVQSAVAAMKAQVDAASAAALAKLTSAHSDAVQQIDSGLTKSLAKLTQDHQKAVQDVQTAETAQIATLNADFTATTSAITAYAGQKAGEASALGNMSLPYSGDKLSAARKAAIKVASGWSAAMPGQATKANGQITSQQSTVITAAQQTATDQTTQIDTAFTTAQTQLQTTHDQAITSAQTVFKTNQQQLKQSAQLAQAQLDQLSASQVASIQGQGAAASSGIKSAGASAIAGIGAGCTSAAQGFASAAKGVEQSAKDQEAPDPKDIGKEVRTQLDKLRTAGPSAVDGLKKQAAGSSGELATQASQSVGQMTQAAAAAKAQAQQLAQSTTQSLTQTADEGAKSLQDSAKTATKQFDTVEKGAATQFDTSVKATKTAYDTQQSTVSGKLAGMVTSFQSGLDTAVPGNETKQILDEAKKAAAAVKPWWQKALAFVASVVVAVVVVIAVTALIATTGPVGAILVGAAAGALSSVAGQMASNLVMGNSLFDGVTVKSVLIGAATGAIGAGMAQGIGAIAKSAAAGEEGFAQGLGESLTAKGPNLAKFAVNMASDRALDAGTQLATTGHYDFDPKSWLAAAATNGVMMHPKIEALMSHESEEGSHETEPDIHTPSLGGGDAGGGGGGGTTHAAGGGPGGGAETHGAGGAEPGTTARAGAEPGANPTNPAARAGAEPGANPTNPTARAGAEPGARPTARDGATAGADPAGTAARGGATSDAGATPTGKDGGKTTGAADAKGETRPTGRDDKAPATDDKTTAPADDKKAPTTDDKKVAPTDDKKAPTTDDKKAPTTDDKAATPDDKKAAPTDDKKAAPADDKKAPATDDKKAAPADDKAAAPADDKVAAKGDAAPGDAPAGPETKLENQLEQLGYDNASPEARDAALNEIKSGEKPKDADLRDTDANRKGLKDLEKTEADPNLSPDTKQKFNQDLAAKLEKDGPTADLDKAVKEVKAEEKAAAKDPKKGITDGKTSLDDFAGGPVSDDAKAQAHDAQDQANNSSLDAMAKEIQTGKARSEQEMLAAIANGEMPRYVARVGPKEMFVDSKWGPAAFGNSSREFVFATEPSDLAGLSPAQAMLKVGWTKEMIAGALGKDVEICVFDTSKAIPTAGGDKTVGVGKMEWPQLTTKAMNDPKFTAEAATKAGVTDPAELGKIFDILKNTPVKAEPATSDPVLADKASKVRKLLDTNYGANELYTGMGATMDNSGTIGSREVMITNDDSKFKLTPDNSRRVPIGKITQADVDSLGK